MKYIIIHAILTMTAWGFLATPACADGLNVSAIEPGDGVISTNIGMERAFTASLGYGHAVDVLNHTFVLGGEYTLPWAEPDFGDYKLRGSALAPFLSLGENWQLLGDVGLLLRGAKTEYNRMTNLGMDLAITGGYFGRQWFATFEAGLDWAMSTHIEHTDLYRETHYADAKDGWYWSTGASLHLGLSGGYTVDNVDIVLRTGQTRTYQLDMPAIPFYITLGVNIRMPR